MDLHHVAAPEELQVRLLPADCMQFTTARYTYTATDTLCPMRYKALQKLQLEFGFDASFKGLMKYHAEMREALKSKDNYEASVLHYNFGKGVANVNEGRNSGMEICALFFNREGENQRTYDHELQLDKVADWEAEGLDVGFFFQRAADLVSGFREAFSALTQTLLEGPL